MVPAFRLASRTEESGMVRYTLTLREPERIDCQSVRLGFC
jgi:hypothetical protein